MRRRLSILSLLIGILFASISSADESLSSKSFIVFSYDDRPTVSASLRKEADFVAMPISISSNHKDPSKRFEAVALAKAAIMKAAEGRKNIRVYSGPVALSAKPVGMLAKFESSGYRHLSHAELHLLAPLAVGKNVFQSAAEMNDFIRSVMLPDKADLELGQIHLAVENPEQYRSKLLKLIADEVSETKKVLGSGQPTVTGLESPVFVRQADERNVDLFLNYAVSLTLRD